MKFNCYQNPQLLSKAKERCVCCWYIGLKQRMWWCSQANNEITSVIGYREGDTNKSRTCNKQCTCPTKPIVSDKPCKNIVGLTG